MGAAGRRVQSVVPDAAREGKLRVRALRSIIADVNVWLDTWSADTARRGEMPTMSAWLGIDVDHFSEPVLAGAPQDARLDARDNLLDARARYASALLRTDDRTARVRRRRSSDDAARAR